MPVLHSPSPLTSKLWQSKISPDIVECLFRGHTHHWLRTTDLAYCFFCCREFCHSMNTQVIFSSQPLQTTLISMFVHIPLCTEEEPLARSGSKSLQVTLSRREGMNPTQDGKSLGTTEPLLVAIVPCPSIRLFYEHDFIIGCLLWKKKEEAFSLGFSPLALRVWTVWVEE